MKFVRAKTRSVADFGRSIRSVKGESRFVREHIGSIRSVRAESRSVRVHIRSIKSVRVEARSVKDLSDMCEQRSNLWRKGFLFTKIKLGFNF